jgi:hypothetical protein
MLRAAIAIGGVIVSFVLLRYAPAPFIWVLFLWFAVLVYNAVTSRRTAGKFISLNVGVVVLVLGAYEAYLWTGAGSDRHDEYPPGIASSHPVLGYAPRENTVARHRRTHGAEVDFDVVYSIDSTGLRVSPPYDRLNCKGSVLFFGGSFTFGSGVDDDETMPYFTGTKTNGHYRIYNFAYRGYGAHQMLSALDHGIVDSIIEGTPRYAIYQAITDHVPRAAGLKRWGKHDPKYVLNDDGEAVYKSSFDEAGGLMPRWLISELMKSKIAEAIAQSYWNRHAYDGANVELFAAVVGAARDIVETRYRGCEFHVILWDSRKPAPDGIAGELARQGLRVHRISDILPERSRYHEKYKISKHDHHPSAFAHERIAEYVTSSIIGTDE